MSSPRVGWRFLPSDEEIFAHFLEHKMNGNDFIVDDDVREVELCKYQPSELPGLCSNTESDDQVWYFFCKYDRNKPYSCRTTKSGFWKSTGQDRTVKSKGGKRVLGTKKSLIYHTGRTPNGKRTEWTIHEHKPSSVLPHQANFVLCKLMKKNFGKVDASACHEDETLRNHPSSNNYRSEIVETGVDRERSVSLENFFHPHGMQQLGQNHKEISSFIGENIIDSDSLFNNGYYTESDVLRSSNALDGDERDFADSLLDLPDDEREFADSLLDLPDDYVSTAPANIFFAQSGKSLQGAGQFELQMEGSSNVQNVHAVAKPKEYQRRPSVPLSGTLHSLKHNDNGRNNVFVDECRAQMSRGVTSDTSPRYSINVLTSCFNESSSGSTTPGKEIYALEESSSSSPSSPEQHVYSFRQEFPESRDYSIENQSARKSQVQRRLFKESAPKTQKPTGIHLSQKQGIDDSGKTKKLIVESEKEQEIVVAAANSKVRTSMSSLIRFESLPTSHKEDPPLVYVGKVLVGLVLVVVIGREMLIFH